MASQENVAGLVAEYQALFQEVDVQSPDVLEDVLVHAGAWTPEAAGHLTYLARAYGSFMLRNALAISLALGIEDGELGF